MKYQDIDLTQDRVLSKHSPSNSGFIDYIHEFGLSLQSEFLPGRIYPWSMHQLHSDDFMTSGIISEDPYEVDLGFRFWIDGTEVFVTGNANQRRMRKAVLYEELIGGVVCGCGKALDPLDQEYGLAHCCRDCQSKHQQFTLRQFLFSNEEIPVAYSPTRDWRILQERNSTVRDLELQLHRVVSERLLYGSA